LTETFVVLLTAAFCFDVLYLLFSEYFTGEREMFQSFLKAMFVSGVLLVSMNSAVAMPPFDEMRNSANDVIARAEQAGNALLLQLGRQLLATIDAMEASAIEVINSGRDAALVVEGELFRDVHETLGRLEEGQEIVANDLDRMTANWASLVARLPWVDASPEVSTYRPRILVPNGSEDIPITVVGPRLADAYVGIEQGSGATTVNLSGDNELIALLSRETIDFPEQEIEFLTLALELDVAPPFSWYKPGTWFASDVVMRDLTFMVMPTTIAQYRIETVVREETTETRDYTGSTNARGRDSEVRRTIQLPGLDAEAGWEFDTDRIRNGEYDHTRTNDRGGSSCTGVHMDSLSRTAVVFRHQIGHINEPFGRRSDGWVDCRVRLPMIRVVQRDVAGPELEGSVLINSDVVEALPDHTVDYSITLDLFDGRTYIVQDDGGLPYVPVSVEHSTSEVHFRPRPPRDF
jgi:hypothetical protein